MKLGLVFVRIAAYKNRMCCCWGPEIDMADYETSLKYFADDVLYEDMIYRYEVCA